MIPEEGQLWWLRATHVGDGNVETDNPREIVRVDEVAGKGYFNVSVIGYLDKGDDGLREGVFISQFEQIVDDDTARIVLGLEKAWIEAMNRVYA